MTTSAIEISSWIVWVLVGIIGAVISARLRGGRRLIAFDLVLGVLGAVLGGWGSVIALGDNSRQTFIMSVLTAILLAAAVLWLFNVLSTRGGGRR